MGASVPKTFVKAFAATGIIGEVVGDVVGERGVSPIDFAISACGYAEPRPCDDAEAPAVRASATRK